MDLIKTVDRMPEPNQLVVVAGGVAIWTGSVWLSKTGENCGYVIQWPVKWWMALPTDDDLSCQDQLPPRV